LQNISRELKAIAGRIVSSLKKMKSKTLIEKQLKRKTNINLVQTIISCKKNKSWNEVASLLSVPSRKKYISNLGLIDNNSKEGDKILIPGKVLSVGNLSKKIKIIGLETSDATLEKIKSAGCEFLTIMEELKINPEAKGIKIIK
jgi:large subunit ribosomal protein L18e